MVFKKQVKTSSIFYTLIQSINGGINRAAYAVFWLKITNLVLPADSAGGVRAIATLEAVHVVAHVYGVNLQFDPVALTLDFVY